MGDSILEGVYKAIQKHIPRDETANKTEIKSLTTDEFIPRINYSHVECFLFIFHQLAYTDPQYLQIVCGIFAMTGQPSDFDPQNTEKTADIRARLTYLMQTLITYGSKVKEVSENIERVNAITEEEKNALNQKRKAAQVALISISNIETLAKSLLEIPPELVTDLPLSWKSQQKSSKPKKKKKWKKKKGGIKKKIIITTVVTSEIERICTIVQKKSSRKMIGIGKLQ